MRLATVILIVASYSLAQSPKVTQAERSNAANEVSARISADAAKSSADALINAERAWMILDRFIPVNTQGSRNTGILFNFKNSGRTPAWITEFSFKLDLSPNEIIIPINYSVMYEGAWADPRPIEQSTPTSEFRAGFDPLPDATDQDRIAAIQDGSLFLYFYGILRYRDIFSIPHETRFCYRYLGVWFMSGPEGSNAHT